MRHFPWVGRYAILSTLVALVPGLAVFLIVSCCLSAAPAPPPRPAPGDLPGSFSPEPLRNPATVFDPPTLRRPPTPAFWADEPAVDAKTLEAKVRAMGASRWADRQRASADLDALGFVALARLEKAQEDPDPEIRRRAGRLVRAYLSVWPSPTREGVPRLLPPIYALSGRLRTSAARIVPHKTDDDRPIPPLGLPQPVGFALFSELPSDHNRPARDDDRHAGAVPLSMLVHGYFLRASAPYRVRERKQEAAQGWLSAYDRWYYGGEEAEREATRLLVVDLLRMGVRRAWVRALLDDMLCRTNTFPNDVMVPPWELCLRFGFGE